jgi:predicted nuclease of restriction endonuclease-like (RecB) superfamily
VTLQKRFFKDPYRFDFLNLAENHFEKELEDGLVGHMTKFLLELNPKDVYLKENYSAILLYFIKYSMKLH